MCPPPDRSGSLDRQQGAGDAPGLFLCGDVPSLSRVLWNYPATGVMRHADSGYDIALDCAREKGLNLPGSLG